MRFYFGPPQLAADHCTVAPSPGEHLLLPEMEAIKATESIVFKTAAKYLATRKCRNIWF